MKTTKLEKINACNEAIRWVATQKNYEEAWQNCEHGDWMLWLAQQLHIDNYKLTLAKGLTAKLVIHLMKDERSINAVNIAIKYGNHQATDEELKIAANAVAAAAAYAANAVAAAAAYAAYAAYAVAAYAAYAAVAAANAAAYAAANAANAAAARKTILKQSADICREVLTEEIFNAYKLLR